MKTKTLIFIAFVFLFMGSSRFVSAQGNLQFNRAFDTQLTVTQTSPSTYDEVTLNVTVPANKVWKLEAASCVSYTASNNATSTAGYILLDKRMLSSGSTSTFNLPVWIPAGTCAFTIKTNSLSTGLVFYGHISGIEFNIVP